MRSELHCRNMLIQISAHAVYSKVIHELGKGDLLHWEDSDGKNGQQYCFPVKNIMITSSTSFWVVF